MTDRNWEQELAKIDKQLASTSDDQLLAQNAAQRAPLAAVAGKNAPAAKSVASPQTTKSSPGSWVAWVQLVVAIAAGSGLWFWPWGTRCGLNAIAFTSATGAVTLLGLWSAIGSWKHRQAYAHVLSFAVMVWGLVLGAREVLPRVGYALPSLERPGGWSCEAPIAPPTTPSAVPNSSPSVSPPAIVPSTQPPQSNPAAGQKA